MWMKIDDRLHAHRKTRAVTRSSMMKRRDIAPMGIWVAAGSWSAQNATDGWVPEEELDRWDDDWQNLADRLVKAGYWWPHERNGEPGYGFNDWLDYNPESEMASRSGIYGNHVRWHANKGVIDPECEHCPSEPAHPESVPEDIPESGGDRGPNRGAIETTPNTPQNTVSAGHSGGESGGESGQASGAIALPVPDPNPTRPDPTPSTRAVALAAHPEETSQTLIAEWIDHCTEKPPSRVIGHVAKEVKTMLDDGIAYERVRRGLAEWNARGLHASVLPSVVHEIANKRNGIGRRQDETDELFERALARAQEGER